MQRSVVILCFAQGAAAAMASVAAAQPCTVGWHSVEDGTSQFVRSLAVHQEGQHRSLFVGGAFGWAGGVPTGPVARWDGFAWSAVGDLYHSGIVYALLSFDDGNGPALYAGGVRPSPGFAGEGVARWDGTSWSALGEGLQRNDLGVICLAVHDDGMGPKLHAGGLFWIPGYGQSGPRNLAKWTGTTWAPVGGGTNHTVRHMLSFDDGGGSSLFISGAFTSAGGMPVQRLARWDGGTWHDIRGSWLSGGGSFVIFDDGTGSALYLAGSAVSGVGSLVAGLLKWVENDWVVVGQTNSAPNAATVWDDGTGEALYIGGTFGTLNGAPIRRIARWDGTTWTGTGAEALIGWSNTGAVYALAEFGDTVTSDLFAGGSFNWHPEDPESSRYIVRYSSCNQADPCYANCDTSTTAPILNVDDFTCFINEFAIGLSVPHEQQVGHYANCDGSTVAPVLNVDDFVCFIDAFAQGCL